MVDMLPLLGALATGTVARYVAVFGAGMFATSDGARWLLGTTLELAGEALQLPGKALEWIGEKIKPEAEDLVLKHAVGDLLIRLHEAEKNGEISTERKREIMTGLSLYLIQAGVKPEDLYDYMREAIEERTKGELDPKLEEEVEKTFYNILSYVEAQKVQNRMGHSL